MKILNLLMTLLMTTCFLSCEKKSSATKKETQSKESTSSGDLSLREQLAQRAEQSAHKTPSEKRKIMIQAIEDLKTSQVMKSALKKGDKMPHFRLRNPQRVPITSKKLLEKGSIVLVFYRGGWCPYCNLQLRDLQKNLEAIKAQGAELVAISPESLEAAGDTVSKQKLGYHVLSDQHGAVAKEFGLMFKLPNDLISVYKDFGIHLDETNSTKKWELPLAATYIVDQKGVIRYAFVEADYKLRAETTEIVEELKKLN